MMFQPDYTDCPNCGTVDHNDYDCPCGCHGDEAPSRARQARMAADFEKGDRVMTPGGLGTVAYKRMAPPSYTRAAVYSVVLDRERTRASYSGTIYPADVVTSVPRRRVVCADCGKDITDHVGPSHECKQQRAANRRAAKESGRS